MACRERLARSRYPGSTPAPRRPATFGRGALQSAIKGIDRRHAYDAFDRDTEALPGNAWRFPERPSVELRTPHSTSAPGNHEMTRFCKPQSIRCGDGGQHASPFTPRILFGMQPPPAPGRDPLSLVRQSSRTGRPAGERRCRFGAGSGPASPRVALIGQRARPPAGAPIRRIGGSIPWRLC